MNASAAVKKILPLRFRSLACALLGVAMLASVTPLLAQTANTTTKYSYDALDRLTQVTDPSGLNTTYQYDGLSDPTSQASPDTGVTARTYDAAGNVLTATDAKGILVTYTYDAQNRRLSASYPDSTQNITYHYDEANSVTGCSGSYPIGRLTRIVENTVTTVYCYDAQGRVIEKQQITGTTTATTGYAYTAAGRLSGMVYPSGTLVTYTRDSDGRIQSLSVTPPNGTASTAVSSVTYQPFGPVSGYTLGNGQAVARSYDANYRLTDLTSPTFSLHVARDAMGDITAIGNAPGANPATETYSYDPLYRLTAITEAGGSVLQSVTYNPTGDRLSKTGSGLATGTYSYNANTHQLVGTGSYTRAVDANGNTTAITAASGNLGFGYNDRNRMAVAQVAGSTVGSYTYDALGERIQKTTGTASETYSYDEGQQLLSEQGTTNRDYVWMGGIPVANVDTTGTTSTVAYVTADQLGAPRAISNSAGTTLWQWAYQGNTFEELSPTSSTGYVYNLRSAGEYYDAETGFHSNGFRTRDPSTWRFLQSDPLGLGGGISTYAVVSNRPLGSADLQGLQDDDAADMSDFERNRLQAIFAPNLGPNLGYESPAERDIRQGECLAPGVEAKGGTYVLIDPITEEIMRSGRSNDLERRRREHARSTLLGNLNFVPMDRTDNYEEQRGLEQMLHDLYDPSLNRVRPISPSNPSYDTYMNAAYNYRDRGSQ